MKRRLFAHEREIQSWRSLTLTSHRVIRLDARQGFESSASIPLAHVQWTRIEHSHRPILLTLAALCGFLGVLAFDQDQSQVGVFSLIAGVVLLAMYLSSRRVLLEVSSGGGRIELPMTANRDVQQQARNFLDAVEEAAGYWTAGPSAARIQHSG